MCKMKNVITRHKTSVTRRKYYTYKRCTKMGGWKITKKPNKKKGSP